MLWGQKSILGHLGSLGSRPVYRSSSFFFCQHANISDMLHPILTSFDHNSKYMNAHLWHDQFGAKVMLGSQGQKGHFYKKCYFSYRLHGMVMWLMHIHQLDTLYKSYWLNFQFGVTGVERSFSPKMLFLLQITWYVHVAHAYQSARYPLQKSG